MASLGAIWKARRNSVPSLASLTPSNVHLGTVHCDPFRCASSRTSFDPRARGGATLSSGVPSPRDQNQWKKMVTVPLYKQHNITAAAYENGSGDGSVTYSSQPPRRRRLHKHFSIQLAKRQGFPSSTEYHPHYFEYLSVTDLPSYSSTVKLPTLTRGCISRQTAIFRRPRIQFSHKRPKHTHTFRMDLKRDRGHETFSFHREEPKLGRLTVNLTARKRISVSVVAKHLLFQRLFQTKEARRKLRRKRNNSTSLLANASLKSDFEYKWKDKSTAISTAIEAYNAVFSVRSRLNPLRFNTRIQVPLSVRQDAPWVCWAHDHGSGWGEFLLGRKGLEVSADFHTSKVAFKKRNSNGNITRIAVDTKGAIIVDKTLITGPVIAGSVATISAHLTNQKADNSLTASVVSPIGVASISANAARSLNVVMDFNVKHNQTLYAFALKLEPKFAAARVSVCF